MEKNVKDLIIVGAGPAGLNAAIYATRALIDFTILEKNAPGGMVVNTYEVENFITKKLITGPDLALEMYNHADSMGMDYQYADVSEIKKEDDVFELISDVGSFYAKTVIFASGNVPRKFNVPNEEKYSYKGISWCAICDGGFYKGKDVIVLGAANAACEEAIYLSGICKNVTLVARSYIKADKIVKERLEEIANIKVVEETTLIEFIGDDNLKGIKVKDNKTAEEYEIYADGVFEFIGLLPNSAPIKDLAELDSQNYVIVNEKMETKTKGLYSVGDVNKKVLRQIVTALNDGAIAAISVSKFLEE